MLISGEKGGETGGVLIKGDEVAESVVDVWPFWGLLLPMFLDGEPGEVEWLLLARFLLFLKDIDLSFSDSCFLRTMACSCRDFTTWEFKDTLRLIT